MKVEIFSGEVLVGTGKLDSLDPPMGVAICSFAPAEGYQPQVHAFTIDGEDNDSFVSGMLSAHSPDGPMDCVGVGILDFQRSLGEMQVHVLGIAEFERYFGDHPHFKSYYEPEPRARLKPHRAFYLAFALWFTATRYNGPGFYAWLLSPLVQDLLHYALFGVFTVVAVLVINRSFRTATFPWADIAVVLGALIGLDLIWRFCRDLALDEFKLVALGVDITAPLLILMGLFHIKAELARVAASRMRAHDRGMTEHGPLP